MRCLLLGLVWVSIFFSVSAYAASSHITETHSKIANNAFGEMVAQQPVFRMFNHAYVRSPEHVSPTEASGPDTTKPEVILTNELLQIGVNIESDFNKIIGWSHRLIPDKTASEVFYYIPKEYLLVRKVGAKGGLQMKFSYGYVAAKENLLKMEFEMGVARFPGDIQLLSKLAALVIKPDNGKPVKLLPWPLSAVTVKLGLEAFVSADAINVSNTPQHVGESIRAIVSMSESTKEEVAGSMRNLGVGGEVLIKFGDKGKVIPLTLSFRKYAGQSLTYLKDVGPDRHVHNLGPFPVKLKGFVGYRERQGKLERLGSNFKPPLTINPMASRLVNIKPTGVFSNNTTLIASWFDFEMTTACAYCLNRIEKEVLAVAGVTSTEKLLIDVVPTVFSQYGLYKIIVEVDSPYFKSGSSQRMVKTFHLREDQTTSEGILYLDRDLAYEEDKFRYRFRAVLANDNDPPPYSEWQSSSAVEITLTPFNFRSLTQ